MGFFMRILFLICRQPPSQGLCMTDRESLVLSSSFERTLNPSWAPNLSIFDYSSKSLPPKTITMGIRASA
jgi:hypothetical protein